jgi:hypothetical protein
LFESPSCSAELPTAIDTEWCITAQGSTARRRVGAAPRGDEVLHPDGLITENGR